MESIPGSVPIKVLGTFLTALLSWRVWRFTIRPRLNPYEPKEYPYWVPFVGHVGGFFSDFLGTIEKGRQHFAPSTEPFAITVAGQTMYVATAADDLNSAWKNSKTLSMDPICMDMFTMADMSNKGQDIVHRIYPDARYNAGNSKPTNPREMTLEYFRQSLSGTSLDKMMQEKTLPGIVKQMNALEKDHPAVIARSKGSFNLSVMQLCTSIFIVQFSDDFYGPKLLQIEPRLIEAWEAWEISNWKFMFQVPGIFAKDMLGAKAIMVDAFTRYFLLPRSERPGASYYLEASEDMWREVGMSENDMAKFMFLQWWAIIGNVYKLAFWLVAYLTRDPSLVEEIRQEIIPAVKGDSIDDLYLQKECPKLEAIVNETLRLTVSTALARAIMEPTVIGGKTLKPGTRLMLPMHPLHQNSQIWGQNTETFDPTRFQENAKLAKGASFRPFGAGHTLCSGRILARRSVNAMVAMLLSRYDLSVESKEFPAIDASRPSPGVVLVAEGHDVTLKCTPR